MYDKILIRYGELTLKHKNRQNFIDKLADNVWKIVGEKPKAGFDRMYLNYADLNLEKLNFVFGITSYSPAIVCDKDLEIIKEKIKLLVKDNIKTFKISARRSDKSYPLTSNELNQTLGAFLLNEFSNLKVDVHNPDLIVNVEIRKNEAFIFDKEIQGLGGLPVGTAGKVLHLMSGGIDSPVAAYQLMKRGLEIVYLSFISPPQTDEKTVNKLKNLIQILNQYQGKSTLHLATYTKLMNYIYLTSNSSYRINLMRRSFYRIASKLAEKNNILALSNGENLGQVASQTLESINTIASQSSLVIFRPLLTNDKNETIEIAKKIKTYELSIQKANETCELFAPKKPVTRPKKEEAEFLENELNMIGEMEEEILNQNIEKIYFN
ncbi:thiamine biosynthesis protein ThiI [Mycoplasmopsis columbina SF7]|uniref:Probable tRNA sulfurtransferase n=1 Tax=Mycoplasmopsis columbina SF7 TaxID=1037410 RepID=F9UKB1_9BACT|nr:tRNA uracil 4-sulfurtransferase ThiI [Mycoplasmopsis columbina]EGV00116.1 thiamine biosynthesis protein ThiI [Mycoplasmopsis columbina SF7]